MSGNSNRRAEQMQAAESLRRQERLKAEANQDPLSRSDNQAVIAAQKRANDAAVRQAQATSAITGATPEYLLAVQKQNAGALSDTYGDIAAGASSRRDRYNEMLEQAYQDDANQRIANEQARQQTYANIITNATKMGEAITNGYSTVTGSESGGQSSYGDVLKQLFRKKKDETETT